MAYQSLYRRYRPRRFAEVLGQEQVVGALHNAVRDERVGHAYLFSGPRGTGKTTTARILAKALNCTNLQGGEPCCECESCRSIESGTSYDLQELDAASNNKVENVRDLIERVALGSPGRTKVYILDEVHMLSAGASNALLKTLEEPPPHVVFVLATTDPHKVLPTIRSRTQHFEFHLLPADVLSEHVRWVIGDAGLDVGPEAVDQVVRMGGGSARDTLSALDQVAASGGVTESTEHADALADAVCTGDAGLALRSVADAVGAGRDPRLLGEALLGRLRDAFLLRMGAELPQATDGEREQAAAWAAQLTDRSATRALEEVGAALLEMRQAPDPRIPLEVALVRLTRPTGGADGDIGPLLDRIERLERAVASGTVPAAAPTAAAPERVATTPSNDDATASRDAGAAPAGPADAPDRRDAAAAPTDRAQPSGRSDAAAASTATASTAGTSRRPGDAARAALARASNGDPPARATASPAPAPQPPPPKPTPRARPAADAAPPAAHEPAAPPAAHAPPAPADPVAPAPATAAERVGPAPAPADPTPPAPSGQGGGANDGLTSVDFQVGWTDGVLPKLAGMAGALYRPASVAYADGVATVSFDNEATRSNADRKRAEVESVVAAHFAQPITVRLTVGSGGAENGGGAAVPARTGAPAIPSEPDDEADTIDVRDLEDAPADTRTGVDRLTEAFPGAQVLPEEPS